MNRWMRGVWVVGVVLLLGVGACSSGDAPPKGLSDGCVANSDCSEGLVCTFGRCHTECKTTRDCPSGARCIATDKGGTLNVCQLPTEQKCKYNSECPDVLVCAGDGQCRNQCVTAKDCVSGQVCANSGVCAEPSEVDAQNNLVGAGAAGTGGSDSGAGGAGGQDASVDASTGVDAAGGSLGSGGASGTGGAGGTGGVDGSADACIAETDPAFCARLSKNCGSVTLPDNCGVSRTVALCGACTLLETCGADNVCKPCTTCGVGQYASAACMATADTVCAVCTTCGSGQYASVACTATADTVCTACTACGAGQYASTACTATSNAVCTVCTTCGAGHYKSAACTATADTVCPACTTCGAGQYRTAACTATADTVCTPCTTCGSGQYASVVCTATTDTFCSSCTTCGSGYTEQTGCSATSDTVCTACKTCGAGQYAGTACTPISDRVCVPCTTCSGGNYEIEACTPSTNRVCVPPRSCAGGLTCNGESCCTTLNVPGGTFTQGGSPEVTAPAHQSTVSSFALDKYEVTVGRFRKYVDAYVSNTASAPVQGAGVNPAVPGTGWQGPWNASLPADGAAYKAALKCDSTHQTWTDTPGTVDEENRAINCVDWYEAFAFCIWDGGRLATESEWEYAAAGGPENRLYPWGSATPDCGHANYLGCSGAAASVGMVPAGNGKWGHADLAGNVFEWVFDWYAAYSGSASNNSANTNTSSYRAIRGGDFNSDVAYLRAAYRNFYDYSTGYYYNHIGVRCPRTSQ